MYGQFIEIRLRNPNEEISKSCESLRLEFLDPDATSCTDVSNCFLKSSCTYLLIGKFKFRFRDLFIFYGQRSQKRAPIDKCRSFHFYTVMYFLERDE